QSGGEELRRSPPGAEASMLAGDLAATRALYLLGQGRDPGPALRGAREVYQRGMDAAPHNLGWRIRRTRAEVVALRWAAKEHVLTTESFQAAGSPLLPLLDRERVDGRLYQMLAEIREIEAAWLLHERKGADEAIAGGLAMAEKALATNPRMA